MAFVEEEIIDKLIKDAQKRVEELGRARFIIEGRVAEEALGILLQELERAIALSSEFQHPLLAGRLFQYFDNPESIMVTDGTVLVHPDADSQAAKARWLRAKEQANIARGIKVRSPRQAAAYWRYRVYGGDRYESTISSRMSMLDAKDAPYWAFLEHGSGPGAWPVGVATHFLAKARRRAQFAYTPVEREVLKQLRETPIEQPMRWSRTWVTSTGRMWTREMPLGGPQRVVQVGE